MFKYVIQAMADDKNKIATPTDDEVARYAGRPDGTSAAAKEAPEETPATLEERLAAAEKQRDDFKDRMLRAQAECANITKRLTHERSDGSCVASVPRA